MLLFQWDCILSGRYCTKVYDISERLFMVLLLLSHLLLTNVCEVIQ